MSDSYFIGTVARLHKIPRFSSPAALQRALKALKNPSDLDSEALSGYFKELADEEAAEIRNGTLNGTLTANRLSSIMKKTDTREIGMIVSLDHTIYFHNPQALRADDWLLTSMNSPWAGEGRGLVTQKVWSREGVHVATCVQEVGFFLAFLSFVDELIWAI
jgi:Thioesterase-like superfamily